MSLQEIATGLFGEAGLLVVALTIIQIAPIKVNPWSTILRAIGRLLNAEVMETIKEHEASSARYRIIRFDDEMRHDTRHTEEHFRQILNDVNEYESYCADHPKYPNEQARFAIENIRKVYEKCRENNDFLE